MKTTKAGNNLLSVTILVPVLLMCAVATFSCNKCPPCQVCVECDECDTYTVNPELCTETLDAEGEVSGWVCNGVVVSDTVGHTPGDTVGHTPGDLQ